MNDTINLDYDNLMQEIVLILENEQSITLATCANSNVTARTMSLVNDGLIIYLQTCKRSTKVEQIASNDNAALAAGNMNVEAYVQILGIRTQIIGI